MGLIATVLDSAIIDQSMNIILSFLMGSYNTFFKFSFWVISKCSHSFSEQETKEKAM